MTNPSIEALAAGLSEAQSKALLQGEGSVAICRALKAKGLSSRTVGTGMAWLAYPSLTPLGDALRAHLKGQPHG